ncbi:NADPH-dependent aldehyde reductase-like protein, chloroplastic [Elaeis guineensis]|uniref:NADPH-dependent aldehyde reductase-like protein, chloroplastic n=1 Tax=Elaeis guineensis var. tenera TaxID=51953 RepID=A0A6I9QZ20_ELAGV|nr:NADPH-dependent aldehyde reductase-like protein, chloroplastic [Elaeis guineensis]
MAAPSDQTPLPLKGRVAIVTGGAGGIGSAISKHLASLGAHVVIGYVGDPTPAENLASAINATTGTTSGPPQAIAVATDVSNAAQVMSLFDAAMHAFGPDLHILVTAAGVIDADYPSIAETSEEMFDWMFGTNCKGTFLCCREAANRLVRGGGGRIITFSSSGVGSLRPGYGVYSGTKGAVEVMTKILARELKGTGITANAVAPGSIETPMFYAGKSVEDARKFMGEIPMGRLGLPEDVAPVVGFLASDAGAWVNAQVVRVNGGNV